MQSSYIRVIYAKGKLFLIGLLAILIVFTVCYQIIIYFSPTEKTNSILLPQETLPTPFAKSFSQEEEEKIVAEVESLPIEEVRRKVFEKAPDELKKLIEQDMLSEETLRELMVVLNLQ